MCKITTLGLYMKNDRENYVVVNHMTCNTLEESQAILHSRPLITCSPSITSLENSSLQAYPRLFLQK
jgi:hypothetical protein